jgi:hypothetical protein
VKLQAAQQSRKRNFFWVPNLQKAGRKVPGPFSDVKKTPKNVRSRFPYVVEARGNMSHLAAIQFTPASNIDAGMKDDLRN